MTDQVDETPVEDHKQGALFAFRRGLQDLASKEYKQRRERAVTTALKVVRQALRESGLGLWSAKVENSYAFALSALPEKLRPEAYQAAGAVVVLPVNFALVVAHEEGTRELELDYEPGLELLTVKRVLETHRKVEGKLQSIEPAVLEVGTLNVGKALAEAIVNALRKDASIAGAIRAEALQKSFSKAARADRGRG